MDLTRGPPSMGYMTPCANELPDPASLLRQIDRLIDAVKREASQRRASWPAAGAEAEPSAANLAAYLALRGHELRSLQRDLMVLGLSSLGRMESRVLPGLVAVRATLAALAGLPFGERPSRHAFFDGEERLAQRASDLLGLRTDARPVGVLVTCPSEAADDPEFMLALARRGVEAVRINCAHDDAATWQRMIGHARRAGAACGRRLRVFMDLAGPKIRTGEPRASGGRHMTVRRADLFAVVKPGALDQMPRGWTGVAVECTLADPLEGSEVGQRLFYDDGKIRAVVVEKAAWGLLARVEACASKGAKIKAEKGLNFPEADFRVPALTAKDLADLDFVAREADAIEYSFVQSPEDVVLLQQALAARREDWTALGLVLKIETSPSVRRLPEILMQACARQPTALMIARGDLAVELGFTRMAEMQEEILWLAEAAHVPVIWATQVLEHLVTKGVPVRGEMTDAAMAARAECVMLNKGPYLLEAIDALDALLGRMAAHQHKKTAQLRPLGSWAR